MSVNKKRNVLLLNSTLFIGGAENVIAMLCQHLDTSRYNVCVGYLKDCGTVGDQLRAEGVEVVPISATRKGRVDYLSAMHLRRFIRRRKIDLVHSHDIHSLVDGAIARLTNRRVRHVHTFHFGNYPHRPRRYLWLERIFSRVPDQLVAVGNNQRAAIERALGIRSERLQVLWNGVSVERPQRRVAPAFDHVGPKKQGKVIIGSISTLIEQKGLPYLLDAVAMLRSQRDNFVLIIAGEGGKRRKLEEQCARLGIGDIVTFLGWVDDAASSVMPYIDVFVQTSLWEAMSMVVLEAMAHAKPIIATRVGDNPCVLVNGSTGILIDPGNVPAIVGALDELIARPERRSDLGRAAFRAWQGEFEASKMAARYDRLYAELLGEE